MSGEVLIQFGNVSDWVLLQSVTAEAEQIGENSYIPLPAVDLGVQTNRAFFLVFLGIVKGKRTWNYGGLLSRIYDCPVNSFIPPIGKVYTKPLPIRVNRFQFWNPSRLSNNNFGFHYQPPAWFKDSELGYEALEEEIDPQRLKQKIDDWNKKGLLDMSPTTSNLVNVMRQLGWRLEPGKWVKDV